jgi:hypothetical protein
MVFKFVDIVVLICIVNKYVINYWFVEFDFVIFLGKLDFVIFLGGNKKLKKEEEINQKNLY